MSEALLEARKAAIGSLLSNEGEYGSLKEYGDRVLGNFRNRRVRPDYQGGDDLLSAVVTRIFAGTLETDWNPNDPKAPDASVVLRVKMKDLVKDARELAHNVRETNLEAQLEAVEVEEGRMTTARLQELSGREEQKRLLQAWIMKEVPMEKYQEQLRQIVCGADGDFARVAAGSDPRAPEQWDPAVLEEWDRATDLLSEQMLSETILRLLLAAESTVAKVGEFFPLSTVKAVDRRLRRVIPDEQDRRSFSAWLQYQGAKVQERIDALALSRS